MTARRSARKRKHFRQLKPKVSTVVAPAGETTFQREIFSSDCGPAASTCQTDAEEKSSVKQVAAAALVLGQNVRKTAEALGVDRRTIQRWRKQDPEFHGALAGAHLEVVVTSRQRMLALSESAVESIETELEVEGSQQLAFALLRGLGVISPDPVPEMPALQTQVKNENGDESATFDSQELPGNVHDFATGRVENTEEDERELVDLPRDQQLAITALFAGKSLVETAADAGTLEETVRSWITTDRAFFRILSEMQFDRICLLKHRLLVQIDKATAIIRKAIAAGDRRVAMRLLRGMGLMQ